MEAPGRLAARSGMAGCTSRLAVLAADDANPVAFRSGPCCPGATTLGLCRRNAGPRVSNAPATPTGAGARGASSRVASAIDCTAAIGSRTVVADTHGVGG